MRQASLTATYTSYGYDGTPETTQVATAEFEYRTVR